MKSGIYIPEPCHENWDKMTPKEQGRFCGVCSKEVVDFTKKTTDDIIDYLAASTGKTCGRFSADQLDENYQTIPVTNVKMRWWKKAGISFLALLGVFGLSKNAKAQKMGKVAIKGDVSYVEDHNTNKSDTQLSGTVKNSEGKTLANATVRIFSGDKQIAETKSIANGSYSVKLPAGTVFNSKITVWAYASGYRGRKIENMQVNKSEIKLSITMDEEYEVMGLVREMDEPVIEKKPEIKPVIKDTVKTVVVKNPEAICEKQPEKLPENQLENKNEIIKIKVVFTESTGIKIFPNPSQGEYTVEINSHLPHHVTVKDLSGKTILTKNHVLNRTKIDISSFADGIYFLVITDAKTMKVMNTQKLVKQ